MADPPPIRRPAFVPPPIPPPRGALSHGSTDAAPLEPLAPAPAATAAGEDIDDTRSLEAPAPSELVEELLAVAALESAALLDRGAKTELADLEVRVALAAWDTMARRDEALRRLELADGHPLAWRVAIAAAIDDPETLATVERSLGDVVTDAARVELAEAKLWRHRDVEGALAIVERLLARSLSPALAAHVRELAILLYAKAERWPALVELRRSTLDVEHTPEEVAAIAALLVDRANDATGALAACWAKLEHFPGVDEHAGGWLRVFDIAIDAATLLDDARRFELLDQRAELVAALPGGAQEALATRHAVASELERDGQLAEAAGVWSQLAEEPAAQGAGSARRIAWLRAAWAATGSGTEDVNRRAALAARRVLAVADGAAIATAHAWRALELATLVGDPSAEELARTVADANDSVEAERWLDVAEALAPTGATIARFAARGGYELRWAAALAEHGEDARSAAAYASAMWKRAAASELPSTIDHALRLARGSDEDALSEAYAAAAATEPDPRSAAALWCARGVVDIARGDFTEAETALARAAELATGDAFCRAALAGIYRSTGRHDALAKVLAELATLYTSKDARAAAARERAALQGEHLDDPVAARKTLEGMVVEHPSDFEALLALARLCERDGDGARALELRHRAAELAPPARAGAIWMEVARAEEARGERDDAARALEKAAAARHPDAAREQARLLRLSGGLDRALGLLRDELAASPPVERRLQLQIEIAQILTELDREPEAVVAAYLDILEHDPSRTEALAWIEGPARQLGMWRELARVFQRAPQTPKNLDVLTEALSQIGDREGAIHAAMLAQAAQPDPQRQHELLRLLRETGRWAEVAAILERELPTVDPRDGARVLELLLELGELRAHHLGRLPEAVLAYESVLDRQPDEPRAIAALEQLYAQLGRDRELARILETRAEAEPDRATRAQLFARIGGLRHDRDDIEGSIAAYAKAFASDPANREVFTAMERVCYKAERWSTALQLYADAIVHVESGQTRAYRLGDLYARRGNVQLNFLGQIDAAIASYQKVVEVDSNPTGAVKILEDVCQTRGDWQPLIHAYEKRAETQRDPVRKADALQVAARIAAQQAGDKRQSVRLNRKLLAMDPTSQTAAAALEQYYEDAQDRTGLVDVLKLKLQQAQDDAEAIEILKRIARIAEEGAKDVVTATEHYKKILELSPKHRDALEALGRIYESTEQWAELVEVTRKLIEVTTDRNMKALLYFRCGSVIEAKFDREQDAIRYYDKAIRTSSACLPAVHGLRDLYRRREEWPRVIETLELEVKLWQDDKERAGVFAQIGQIHEKHLGDAERALQFYETAIQTDPECLLANQALFEHYYEQSDWQRAETFIEQLAAKAMREGDPQTRSEFFRKAGFVARMMGDARRAAEDLISSVELRPTNTAALDDLGALARESPEAWDFENAYLQLEKVYKKRDDADPLLARVHVGRAAIIERAGDLDQAAALYRQAVELAPGDLTVLSALVDFHADMRHWDRAVTAIELFVASGAASPADRLAALLRRAEIHADGAMEPARAIEVLHDIIAIEPGHQDAYYQLAQQYFLLGHYAEARDAIDRVIELATAPANLPLVAANIARYYYYKGRILDAAGESRAAAPQYRRAIEYDPGYAPPALVLARRAADAGDQRQAETLLIEAAHAAMATGGQRAAVPLQRGLARILLASGDRPAAIEAYRGILNVEPEGASDRVALAEIYALDDPRRAIGELRKVLDRDIHHAPAYRSLAAIYSQIGDRERAFRVLTALDSLGFAEDEDRTLMLHLRGSRAQPAPRRAIDELSRAHYLLTPAAQQPLAEVFDVFAEELTSLVTQPSLGINLTPAQHEPRLVQLANQVGALFETDAEVFLAEKVPGFVAVTAFPRRLLVIDRTLLSEPEPALRFLFGYAFEAIRGGYATLLQVGARKRRELALLLSSLLSADAEAGAAVDLINNATEEQQQVLEEHAGSTGDPAAWMDGMLALAKRAGLLMCDDFSAAIWMVARLAGEQLASHDETIALGSVLGGPDLVRFYLSDEYQQLRDRLTSGA